MDALTAITALTALDAWTALTALTVITVMDVYKNIKQNHETCSEAWARGRMIVCPKCSNRKQLFELIYNPKGEQLCEKCGGKFSSHFTPSDSHLKKMNREKEQK